MATLLASAAAEPGPYDARVRRGRDWLAAGREVYFLAVFERFTERARRVVVLAQQEAHTLRHDYIGDEHILLGLLLEDEGLAARVLESLGLTVGEARAAVVRIVGVGAGGAHPSRQIPFTPRAKKVLAVAVREAWTRGDRGVATEHILLALVEDNEGPAARILLDFGLAPQKVRDEAIRMLPPSLARSPEPERPPWKVVPGTPGEIPVTTPSGPRTLFGWRSRSIALAALGATALSRRAFGSHRGEPDGLALEILIAAALAEEDPAARSDLDRRLSLDAEGFAALETLLAANLVEGVELSDAEPQEEDDEDALRLTLTDEGAAAVQAWLTRVAPLFTRWPAERPDVDDAY